MSKERVLDNFTTFVEAVVVDIKVDEILGLDFLSDNNGIIDMTDKTLKIDGKTYFLSVEGHLSLSENACIPAKSEMLCEGNLIPSKDVNVKAFMGLIEPYECFHASGRAFIGRTVVYAEEKFPIRLMNVTSEPQHIYRNTVVGNISPVESLIEAQPTKGTPTSFKHEGAESESMLPIHLKQLYASSAKYLSDDQANKLRRVGLSMKTCLQSPTRI
jgi:hypothetical protein